MSLKAKNNPSHRHKKCRYSRTNVHYARTVHQESSGPVVRCTQKRSDYRHLRCTKKRLKRATANKAKSGLRRRKAHQHFPFGLLDELPDWIDHTHMSSSPNITSVYISWRERVLGARVKRARARCRRNAQCQKNIAVPCLVG